MKTYLSIDWDDYNICPICYGDWRTKCKCPLSDTTCVNGHTWHFCLVHKRRVEGTSDHSKSSSACACTKNKLTWSVRFKTQQQQQQRKETRPSPYWLRPRRQRVSQ